MTKKKLPESAIIYIKLMTTLLCSWPPSSRATNRKKIIIDFWWCLMFLTTWSSILPILYTGYVLRHDFMEITKNICFTASVSQGMIKMLISRQNRREFQELIEELEIYLQHAEPHEREALDACVRKAAPIYVTFTMVGYTAAFSYICGPLVLDQHLPFDTLYPFSTDHYPTHHIVYTFQSISLLQCSSTPPLDSQINMLIWFSIARLKLLAYDLKNVASIDDLHDCIRVHQGILRFYKRVTALAKLLVMTTVAMATISIAFGSIHVVGKTPLEVKVQFMGLVVGYSLQLYLSAWPAENFMNAMDDVKGALYGSSWFRNSKNMKNSVIIVLQRLNRIPIISVTGVIPELSLNYYAVYLSKTMSFFTTLRVMLQKVEESLE